MPAILSAPPGSMPAVAIQTAREVELESEAAHLRAELEGMREEMATFRRRLFEESEQEIVKLALTVARRAIDRELTADPTLDRDWVLDRLSMLTDSFEP